MITQIEAEIGHERERNEEEQPGSGPPALLARAPPAAPPQPQGRCPFWKVLSPLPPRRARSSRSPPRGLGKARLQAPSITRAETILKGWSCIVLFLFSLKNYTHFTCSRGKTSDRSLSTGNKNWSLISLHLMVFNSLTFKILWQSYNHQNTSTS